MNAMGTAVEGPQFFILSGGGGEGGEAGIPTRQEDDPIVYTLYGSPCYATIVGCTGFTGERLQQVVAVEPIHR